jgi:hypothetical protein
MKGKLRLTVLAAVTLLVAVGVVIVTTRPNAQRVPMMRVTEVQREPGDPRAARDEEHHFAPGSPAAVAERFLRARLRYHYDDAAALATAGERARCERNVTQFRELNPEAREAVRQAQLIAEAAQFDLERVVTEDLSPGEGGVARKRVHGVVYAHGTVENQMVENRRAQELVLHLVNGAWRVAVWTPAPAAQKIQVH